MVFWVVGLFLFFVCLVFGLFWGFFYVYPENLQAPSLNHRIQETGNALGHKRSSIIFIYNSSIVPEVALNDM